VLEVDSPVRGRSPPVHHRTAGTFRIEVTPFEESGNFAIRVIADEPKATTPEGTVDQLMVRSDSPAHRGAVGWWRDATDLREGYGSPT